MAQIERIHSERTLVDFSAIRTHCQDLARALESMVRHLEHMAMHDRDDVDRLVGEFMRMDASSDG